MAPSGANRETSAACKKSDADWSSTSARNRETARSACDAANRARAAGPSGWSSSADVHRPTPTDPVPIQPRPDRVFVFPSESDDDGDGDVDAAGRSDARKYSVSHSDQLRGESSRGRGDDVGGKRSFARVGPVAAGFASRPATRHSLCVKHSVLPSVSRHLEPSGTPRSVSSGLGAMSSHAAGMRGSRLCAISAWSRRRPAHGPGPSSHGRTAAVRARARVAASSAAETSPSGSYPNHPIRLSSRLSGGGGSAPPKNPPSTAPPTAPPTAPTPSVPAGVDTSAQAATRSTEISTPSAASSRRAYALDDSRQLSKSARRCAASSRSRSRSAVVPSAAPVSRGRERDSLDGETDADAEAEAFRVPVASSLSVEEPPSDRNASIVVVSTLGSSFPKPSGPRANAVAAAPVALSEPPPGTSTGAMSIFMMGSYTSRTMNHPTRAFWLTLGAAAHTTRRSRRARRRSATGRV